MLYHISIILSRSSTITLRRGELSQYNNNNFGRVRSVLWIFWMPILSWQQEAISGHEASTNQKGTDQTSLILWNSRDCVSWNKMVSDVLLSRNWTRTICSVISFWSYSHIILFHNSFGGTEGYQSLLIWNKIIYANIR